MSNNVPGTGIKALFREREGYQGDW
jgi:hypothetical protein